MRLWQPNRNQWRVIWAVYCLVIALNIRWTSSISFRSKYSQPSGVTNSRLSFKTDPVILLVIGGALLVWRLQPPPRR